MSGDGGDEGVRPPEGHVDSQLVPEPGQLEDPVVVDTHLQFLDLGTVVHPANLAGGCAGRLGRQVDADGEHGDDSLGRIADYAKLV